MCPRRTILLASESPRRRSLLEAACYDVRVMPTRADETWPGGDILQGAITLARRKLDEVAERAGGGDAITVAADTLVLLDALPMGKPADADEAMEMLTALSGREHSVVTGYCVARGRRRREGVVTTRVLFRPVLPEEIKWYIASGEPFDKAGGYGIQGLGGALVDRLEGSYTNVVGLPLKEVIDAVEEVA